MDNQCCSQYGRVPSAQCIRHISLSPTEKFAFGDYTDNLAGSQKSAKIYIFMARLLDAITFSPLTMALHKLTTERSTFEWSAQTIHHYESTIEDQTEILALDPWMLQASASSCSRA